MADKKISELVSITGSATAADDYFVVVDTSGAVTYKISREELNNAIEQDVLENISITNLTSDLNTNGNDIKFADNDKAIFGDAVGGDLQIYHDGSNSYINEQGTGNLKIIGSDISIEGSGETHATFVDDGAVTLYHNNAIKFATSAVGCDIAGTVTADGLSVDGDGLLYSASNVEMRGNANVRISLGTAGTSGANNNSNWIYGNGNNLRFNNAGGFYSWETLGTERMRLDSSGKVGIGTSTNTTHSLFIHDSDYQQLGLSGTRPTIFLKETDGNANENYQIRLQDGNLQFETQNDAQTGATERMRIDINGQVGLSGGTASFDTTGSVNGLQLHYQTSSGQATIGSYSAGGGTALAFHTNTGGGASTEAMRIDSNGKLCVGTTSAVSLAMLTLQPADTNRIINTRSFNTSLQYHHVFENNSGTLVGGIAVSTTSTTYNTSSDYRLKTAVTYDWDATSRLKQLKPARFEWIADGDDAVPVDGFLAHEVQDIVPEAISGTKDAVDDEGNPQYQGIDQSKLTPLLTKALIEAVEKIEQLEARITALETS